MNDTTKLGRRARVFIRTGGDHDNPEWTEAHPVTGLPLTTTEGAFPMSITSKARKAERTRAAATAARGRGCTPPPGECRHCGRFVEHFHHRQTCRRMQAKRPKLGRKAYRRSKR